MRATWLDRAIGYVSPGSQLRRMSARARLGLLERAYDAATEGRRTQGWRRNAGDANAVLGLSLAKLRDHARDLVRNNPYAESALTTIVDNVVGWGIVPAEQHARFNAWANSTACDADGLNDFAGLQKLVVRGVVESGEVLVRRRIRRLDDGLPLPLQLQVLEADFLDTAKDVAQLPNGGRIVQGVEFNALGRRVAYWLFRDHPGGSLRAGGTLLSGSHRVSADDVTHVFRVSRPGQVRGPSWFAPVLLPFRDFDEYDDATLMKQKIAACLAVITSDVDGTSTRLGEEDEDDATIDTLSPGMIMNVPPGRSVEVVQPPSVRDFSEYAPVKLRGIAAGLHVTYEDMTGDYTDLPFSAARMSRLRNWARVDDSRWRMLVPQLLNPVWTWAMDAARVFGDPGPAATDWTAPPMAMIEPDKEGLAIMRNIRAGIQTLSDALRERGYVPAKFLEEMAKDYELLDELKLVLDSDPRKMTQAGQLQGSAAGGAPQP